MRTIILLLALILTGCVKEEKKPVPKKKMYKVTLMREGKAVDSKVVMAR